MASLYGIAGPLKGAIFRLSLQEVSVGRLASNHLCVGDPSVSRQHCLIWAQEGGFQIRDLSSNNGTFINGNPIEQSVLANGDKIRIGDTVFRFVLNEAADEEGLRLADNGVVAVTALEQRVSSSVDTALARVLETVSREGANSLRAKALLRIGAILNSHHDPEALQIELLKQILEASPAELAAIVLLAQGIGREPSIVGWDWRSGQVADVPVSRTLVARALNDSFATFSDDVTAHSELRVLNSLSRRQVLSVVVMPLVAEQRTIGAIYLDSANPLERLTRGDLEFVGVIAEYAALPLDRVLRLKTLHIESRRLESALTLEHNLIGCSPVMRQVADRIGRIASSDATAIIRGETGTGKELAARAIHQNSARARRPFEAINCSLLRDTLLESELFGHEKGSFTGAIAQKKGKLELADGGTIFLDELGELGEAQQAMLLRVLQTREFQRVGGSRIIRVDLRIIAATNKNLEEAVQNKEFREDLYYRLNVVSVTMPPLRERLDDIPLLADHFVQLYSRKNKRLVTGVSREAAALLRQHSWPGNVRELENAIEYAIVFGSTDEILPEDLPGALTASSPDGERGYYQSVREAKRNIVRSAIEQAGGNYGDAARSLGIHVNNLHRLIRDLGLKARLGAQAPKSN
jgi:transcriptional regulator with GAF, ATPase, and Fis domain